MQPSAPERPVVSTPSFNGSNPLHSNESTDSDEKSTDSSDQIDIEQGKTGELPVQEKHESVPEVSWEDDKANARNWSKFQRIYHTLIPGKCKSTIYETCQF
jgi:hypothetical protein